MKLTEIPNEQIKVGDIVGIVKDCRIGLICYKHVFVEKIEVAKITPKRTKFVSTDGKEFARYMTFYKYDEAAQTENDYAEKIYEIAMDKCQIKNWLGKNSVNAIPDEAVTEIWKKLKEIKALLIGA